MKSLLTWINQGPGQTLKPVDREILMVLVNAAGPKDVRRAGNRWVAITYAGIDLLAERVNVSGATIKRALKRLEQAGIITRRRTFGSNALTIVEWHETPRKPTSQSDPRESANCTQEGSKVIPLLDQNDPAHLNQSLHISKKTSVVAAGTSHLAVASSAGTSTKHATAAAAADISHHPGERGPAATVNTETLEQLIAIGIGTPVREELAATALTPAGVRKAHSEWKQRGGTTGLLVMKLWDAANAATVNQAWEVKQQAEEKRRGAERARLEPEAVAGYLTNMPEALAKATAKWNTAHGTDELATVTNPAFIDWCIENFRAAGMLDELVNAHVREEAAKAAKARTLAPEPRRRG